MEAKAEWRRNFRPSCGRNLVLLTAVTLFKDWKLLRAPIASLARLAEFLLQVENVGSREVSL